MFSFFSICFHLFKRPLPGISKSNLFWTYLKLKLTSKKGSGELFNANIFGKTFFGTDKFTLSYLFYEVYIKKEYWINLTKSNPLIYDCGSNVGMGISFFKHLFPKAKIIAFEANPLVFSLLEKNVEQHHLEDVHLHQIALYDHDTEISFFLGKNSESLMGSIYSDRGGKDEVLVKAKRLSSFLRETPDVDLIKIDVEGAEWEILKDLDESGVIRNARQYLIEFHLNIHRDTSSLSDFLRYFEKAGFTYNIRGEFIQVGEFQDLLIHCLRID